jgi:hypothetical protein
MVQFKLKKPTPDRSHYSVLFHSVGLLGVLFILPLLLGVTPCYAQHLRLAYYGETIVHYGAKGSVDYPLKEKRKTKQNGRTVSKTFLFHPGMAIYHHRHNHTGLIISPEFTYQRTGNGGGLFELGISPSYFRYFLAGTTFEVTPEGDLRKVPLAGRSAFLPTLSIALGKDLSIKHQLPIAWFTRLNLSLQTPYNASYLPRFAFEAGVSKKLSLKLF